MISLVSGQSLDYETATSHTLTVSAAEADGSGSDTATITINVNNIDDNDPSIADVTVAVDENINDTFTITDLSDTSGGDTDADGSALTYSITAGNSAGLFEIDSATGVISLVSGQSLDYETATSHTLTVSAAEADGSGSDTATITINVNNIDDNDPSIADVTVAVDENINDTFTITDLSDTSGGDTDADGSALTYSITAGNSAGLFEIVRHRRDLTYSITYRLPQRPTGQAPTPPTHHFHQRQQH